MAPSGGNPGESTNLKRRFFSFPTLISLALAGAFLVFVATRFDVDVGATWEQVRGGNPWYLALAFLVHYSTFILRGARWRLLLRNTQGDDAPVPGVLYCSQLLLLGWFANAVGWLRLGDAYRAYLHRDEQGASFPRTIGTILAERTLDAILVVLMLAAAVPFLVSDTGRAAWAVLGLAVVLVFLLAFVLAAMTWAREWTLRKLPDRLSEHYRRFQEGTMGSFRRVLPATVLGLLGWLAEVGRLYLVVQALDLDLGLAVIVFLTLANSLLTLFPTPGGLGAVESGVSGLAVRLSSLASSAAVAMVLVDRAISYASIIALGALVFVLRQAFRRRSSGTGRPLVQPGSVEDR
ncbi:MAG: flippase-like domain-containing protein [Dehalococcoidia bacterium]|jgi:hypothetical protein|nr:flippase-like domain-containing protein [Dehalococcoidia bacterium]